jgi:hypothetical protein
VIVLGPARQVKPEVSGGREGGVLAPSAKGG